MAANAGSSTILIQISCGIVGGLFQLRVMSAIRIIRSLKSLKSLRTIRIVGHEAGCWHNARIKLLQKNDIHKSVCHFSHFFNKQWSFWNYWFSSSDLSGPYFLNSLISTKKAESSPKPIPSAMISQK